MKELVGWGVYIYIYTYPTNPSVCSFVRKIKNSLSVHVTRTGKLVLSFREQLSTRVRVNLASYLPIVTSMERLCLSHQAWLLSKPPIPPSAYSFQYLPLAAAPVTPVAACSLQAEHSTVLRSAWLLRQRSCISLYYFPSFHYSLLQRRSLHSSSFLLHAVHV